MTLSAAQLLAVLAILDAHATNPALVATIEAAWQEARAAQPTTTESETP